MMFGLMLKSTHGKEVARLNGQLFSQSTTIGALTKEKIALNSDIDRLVADKSALKAQLTAALSRADRAEGKIKDMQELYDFGKARKATEEAQNKRKRDSRAAKKGPVAPKAAKVK